MYPRPPRPGKIIPIDEEMRSVEIAGGIDRTGDAGLGWNRSIDFGAFPDRVLTESLRDAPEQHSRRSRRRRSLVPVSTDDEGAEVSIWSSGSIH